MKPPLVILLAMAVSNPLPAAENLLIIGDSLSKEYEYEILGIGGNTNAQGIRNWCEILDERRNSYFDFGNASFYWDARLTGHQFNWSIPGSYAYQWSDYLWNDNILVDDLQGDLGVVERVVIFIGGNDVRANYGSLYDGTLSLTTWSNEVYNDIYDVVDWVQDHKPNMQIVLVGVPHTGCTPKTATAKPYNATKTGRVTNALTLLNNRLATLASTRNIGWCPDIFQMTTELLTRDEWCIGGVPILKNPPNDDGDPLYLFLGDGFHPNEPTQAVFAQKILDCFNAKYSLNIPRLTNTEILVNILGLRTDLPFDSWTKGYNLPSGQRGTASDYDGDGIKNLMEYALDLDPTKKDTRLLPQPVLVREGSQRFATLTWKPRHQDCALVSLVPQQSTNLGSWQDVPPTAITDNANGTRTVKILLTGPLYLRLKATMLPTN